MSNLDYWSKCSRPPAEALKQIKGGRLKGMTDISPQWRYRIMTEMFGPVGVGWKYEVCDRWSQVAGNEVAVFVSVKLCYKHNGEWSEAVSGSGGSKLVASETSGLHFSDEAYKMAETDALSVAMKQIGVGADIYMGMWDGSKYKTAGENPADDAKYLAICEQYADSILAIKTGIKEGDLSTASEAWFELSDEVKAELWKAPKNGGCFTTAERATMKSQEFRTANTPEEK